MPPNNEVDNPSSWIKEYSSETVDLVNICFLLYIRMIHLSQSNDDSELAVKYSELHSLFDGVLNAVPLNFDNSNKEDVENKVNSVLTRYFPSAKNITLYWIDRVVDLKRAIDKLHKKHRLVYGYLAETDSSLDFKLNLRSGLDSIKSIQRILEDLYYGILYNSEYICGQHNILNCKLKEGGVCHLYNEVKKDDPDKAEALRKRPEEMCDQYQDYIDDAVSSMYAYKTKTGYQDVFSPYKQMEEHIEDLTENWVCYDT